MAEEMARMEETSAMDSSTDSGEGAALEETAQEWNDKDFEDAFDGVEPEEEKAAAETAPTVDEAEAEPKSEGKITVGGREYAAADVEGLLSRLTELQAQANTVPPERAFLERIAALSGMDVDAFMKDGEKMLIDHQAQARTAQLMEQGLSEEMAKHVAQLEAEREAAKNAETVRGKAEAVMQAERTQSEAQMRANVEEFARMFPDVKEIPDEVIAEIERTGQTPVIAYQNYLLTQKEKELAALRQTEKNRRNTTGSVKGTPKGAEDSFLVGLFGE